MKHVIDTIATDHHSLTRSERAHAENCAMCGNQLRMMQRIEDGIQSIPAASAPVPEKLRSLVFARIREPLYQIWHILAAGTLAFVSPFFLKHFVEQRGLQLSGDMLTVVFAGYGILIVLLIVPLSYRLFDLFNEDVHDLEHRVDAFLDQNPVRSLGVAIRKRVGF